MRLVSAYLTIILALIGVSANSFAIDCVNTTFLFDIEPKADQPSDLAVAPNGDIYLVDGVNNRIIVVDSNGRWKFAFGSYGSDRGKFKYPLGIDISDTGRVYVADTRNHRIQVFSADGKFLSMFNIKHAANEQPSDPVDVAVSPLNNYLYVSDNDNHKIRVYDQKGKFQFEWGTFGEDYGTFRYPGIISLNQFNEVFIVDVLNTRIQKFDPFGKFISDIGSWGVLQGKLFRPKGVAVDAMNRVYISDSYMGVIQVFTDLGRVIGVICEKNRVKKYKAPVGIVVDKNNRLLVVEMRGNKITVQKLL